MRFAVNKMILALCALGLLMGNAQAVDFSIEDIHGKTHKLSDYRGKWVVVNYWATWCPPCLDEIPDLVEFHDKHREKDAVVLGINTEALTADRLRDFADSYFVSYPVLIGEPVADADYMLGPIPGLPTTYIVSPKGEVLTRNVGPLTGSMIEDYITEACKDKKYDVC
ncbi:TlpA disulfide reductase family protein [Sulfuriflexus sp.]|uniref:TlpA disulfide reductase family protein n=1 Tax=Sulfuriflexus sp. TaxID=2015443 RepID=UPI0028CE4F53|nr:TlpA disulfide reductase family protein [Sulfuriflexus sp.]MDT8403589.1 TlpA disulfide reductase family protein [Sulfuriflexus sp.]